MKNNKSLIKRKKFLISKGFQFRFIAYSVVTSMISIFFFFIAYYLFFDAMMDQAIQVGLTNDEPYYFFLEEQKRMLGVIFLTLSSILFVVLFLLGMIYSHRIVGPIYAINTYISKKLAGEPADNLKLRKSDNFHETADLLNKLINKYEDKEQKN